MTGKIFINYRRGDDPQAAGRLFDRLQDVFGPEQLFLDVDSIPPGVDFVHELSERVAGCDVFLVVIGKHWIDARDAQGQRRLDDPDDFVRVEIASGLRQNKRLIPVLVGEAQMPRAEQLPEDIRALARRNAVRLTHERFRMDTHSLVRALQEVLATAEPARSVSAAAGSTTSSEDADRPASRGLIRPLETLLRRSIVAAALVLAATTAAGLAYWYMARPGAVVEQQPQPAMPSAAPSPKVAEAPSSPPAKAVTTPPQPAAPVAKAPQPSKIETPQRFETFAPLSAERERSLKAGETFKECERCPEMSVVPAGRFIMGSSMQDIENELARDNERPQHEVTIPRPFAIGRFEVTRGEFEAFVIASGYKPGDRCFTFENGVAQERTDRSFRNPGFPQTANHPAVCVSWTDAKAYVAWLSNLTGKSYRLPSESEWEYAARAGSAARYGYGNDASELCKYANGADQSAKLAGLPSDYVYMPCTDGHAYTSPVGSFQANKWGLYDLLGNAWEATQDCFADDYSSNFPTDGSALDIANCEGRTVRGGSWFSNELWLRPAVRAKAAPLVRHDDLGFRVARTLNP